MFTLAILHCTDSSSSSDELPASRIAEILTASLLSDEDIELLMGKLLEKQEANVEWEAVRERKRERGREGGSEQERGWK